MWWGYADKKVGCCQNFVGKWRKCIQYAQLFLASGETIGQQWCGWIWELWQQHVQDSSGSVGAGWSDTWYWLTRVVLDRGLLNGSLSLPADTGMWCAVSLQYTAQYKWLCYCSLLTTAVMSIGTTATRSTQPCIPPGSLNRVPASAGVKAGMSPLPGGR